MLLLIVPGGVEKCGPDSFLPDLAHFGRFGGISRQNGLTDHPTDKRPLKRKFGKNKGAAGQSRTITHQPKMFS